MNPDPDFFPGSGVFFCRFRIRVENEKTDKLSKFTFFALIGQKIQWNVPLKREQLVDSSY